MEFWVRTASMVLGAGVGGGVGDGEEPEEVDDPEAGGVVAIDTNADGAAMLPADTTGEAAKTSAQTNMIKRTRFISYLL